MNTAQLIKIISAIGSSGLLIALITSFFQNNNLVIKNQVHTLQKQIDTIRGMLVKLENCTHRKEEKNIINSLEMQLKPVANEDASSLHSVENFFIREYRKLRGKEADICKQSMILSFRVLIQYYEEKIKDVYNLHVRKVAGLAYFGVLMIFIYLAVGSMWNDTKSMLGMIWVLEAVFFPFCMAVLCNIYLQDRKMAENKKRNRFLLIELILLVILYIWLASWECMTITKINWSLLVFDKNQMIVFMFTLAIGIFMFVYYEMNNHYFDKYLSREREIKEEYMDKIHKQESA